MDKYVSRWKYENFDASNNVFPCEYERMIEDEKRNKHSEINSESYKRKQRTDAMRQNKPENNYTGGGAAIGACAGLVGCLYGCCTNIHSDAYVFACTLIPFAVAFIIGIIIDVVTSKSYKDSMKNADVRMDEEEKNVAAQNQKIDRECNERKNAYVRQFELEAQNLSVNFAESDLAQKVIVWISDGFIDTIKNADRSSHIKKIDVPFIFNVYADKITCNLGEFNFEIQRCSKLRSPLEETALARAIASSVQVNIAMKFPEDPSGTGVVIDKAYEYFDDHISVTVNYSAPNGGYQEVKSW